MEMILVTTSSVKFGSGHGSGLKKTEWRSRADVDRFCEFCCAGQQKRIGSWRAVYVVKET